MFGSGALQRKIGIWRSEAGNTAAEFALVLPVFILLTLGTIGLCLLMYAVAALHYAAEDAARCASVKTAVCVDNATTATYAATRYMGPTLGAIYTLTPAASGNCGNKVVATATYSLQTGLATISVPLSASSCYPSQS